MSNMKQNQRVVLMASMVFAAGLAGFSAFGENNIAFESEVSPMSESSDITGHVILKVADADGNIKHYAQTDNIVTAAGKNCIKSAVFGDTSGCTGTPGTFNIIGLSAVSYGETATTADTTLPNITALAGDLAPATATTNAGTDATGTGNAQAEFVHTFTWTQTTTQTVTSAYLADTTGTTGNALAIRDMTTNGPFNLNENDTLEVTWQITLG